MDDGADGFTEMLDRAQAFYGALAANNSRDWFEPRKADWTADIRRPAELFAGLMAEEVARLTGEGHAPKLFRINRDVRFSKDKSPYKTSLSMLWTPAGGGAMTYFAIEPDATLVGCGLPEFSRPQLTAWRAMVDREGAEVAARLAEVEAACGGRLGGVGPEPLKRVPKPHAPDHPQGELLRLKGLVLGAPLAPGWRDRGGLIEAVAERVAQLLPLRALLARLPAA
jgi:uncharacterized protein (TIGR02453 family)